MSELAFFLSPCIGTSREKVRSPQVRRLVSTPPSSHIACLLIKPQPLVLATCCLPLHLELHRQASAEHSCLAVWHWSWAIELGVAVSWIRDCSAASRLALVILLIGIPGTRHLTWTGLFILVVDWHTRDETFLTWTGLFILC